ncbi:hypothetical protein COL35_29220 [Bacillus toyonensis]|uniref:glycoside hydrolase domain-containing protein n=1 Tax=Bacillus toyonensis TaxID=155322 RepID=UPI000BF34300|nr:glycoside hydrolase domain-containing protein [Bacillus toyonensis]PFX63071.1 hypothetical protein COL35_29220 [Bacillus toyonensis]
MSFQGFDKSPAITKVEAQAMWDEPSPFHFYGFYLGGPCYVSYDRYPDGRAKSFTAQLHQDYIDIGFKLAYIYVGCQDQPNNCHAPTTDDQGDSMGIDGAREAVGFATSIGVPVGSVIYLDVEGGNSHSNGVLAYVSAWVKEINSNSNFWAGIYCSAGSNGSVAQQLFDAVNGMANMWVAQYQCNPGSSKNNGGTCIGTSCSSPAITHDLNLDATSFSQAYIRQYAGNVHVNYNGTCLNVDLNVAREQDPNIVQFQIPEGG